MNTQIDQKLRASEISLTLEIHKTVPAGDIPKMRKELAECRRDLALQALKVGDPNGWPDLFDAITRFGQIGDLTAARALLAEGQNALTTLSQGRQRMEDVLHELEKWLNGQTQ